MSRLKKISIIVGFILVTIVLGYVLYLAFFKPLVPKGPAVNANVNAGPPTAVLPTAPGGGRLPSGAEAVTPAEKPAVPPPPAGSPTAAGGLTQVTALTAFQVFQPTLSTDGSFLIYYDRTAGKFYKISPDGQSSLYADKNFYEVENITWAPSKTQAIIEYPDGANIFYDFAAKKQVTLPKHWQEFSFSPQSNQIVSKSLGIDPENRFLIVAEPDGSKARVVEDLGENAAKVITSWSPNNQMVAMVNEDINLDRKEILFIGLNNENFKSMTVEGWGFQGQWSPQGDKILYSVYNAASEDKPQLWVSDATSSTVGRNRQDLRLQTWANKCSFYDNNTVFCAVPRTLETGAGMFPEEMDNSADVLYKVNLTAGTKSLIAQPTEGLTMENLTVSPDGQYLFFTNKGDGRLYEIKLR